VMTYKTLISCRDLAPHIRDPNWAVVDCRFSLDDTQRGRREYRHAHIPGAVYAHLDEDLSGPVVAGQTGRHPLPDIPRFAARLSQWGIADGVQVVAYDDSAGSMAARLWWMLRWLGHDAVAVLDGGWQRWIAEKHPTHGGEEPRQARAFAARPRPELVVDADAVLRRPHDADWRIVDSRAAVRYRGEQEPIDALAGHIPGAVNAPHAENLGPDGLFQSKERLKERFRELLGDAPPARTVFYCGSGVSAAQNVLAYLHAGLGEACLYPGSWSEWIVDPSRPIETG